MIMVEIGVQITVISLMVFGLVDAFKPFWDPAKRENLGDKIAAGVFAVRICVLVPVDAFPALGIPLRVAYLGSVLTGFLIMGGGKIINDALGLVKAARDKLRSTP